MGLPQAVDLRVLRRVPKFAFYIRYPLHHKDFHEIRADARLRGYYTAKPLHGRLTTAGKVDRSAGFNGEIAAIFIPSPARSAARAELLVTCMPRAKVTLANGQCNWPAIRRTAEKAILDRLGSL